jgi:FkbM family methyltransferase
MKKTVIEVGANKGQDTAKWVNDPTTSVYAFEPHPKYYKKLSKIFKGKENFFLFNNAVDIEEESKIFNLEPKGCSSLYNFNANIDDLWADRGIEWKFYDNISVKTIRLDTVIDLYKIAEVDYLWIDAQGNDFRVLQSLGNKISIVKEGRCETALNLSLYEGPDNSTKSVVTWLTQQGFATEVIPDRWNKEADILFKKL